MTKPLNLNIIINKYYIKIYLNLVGDFISVKDNLLNLFSNNKSIKNSLKKHNTNHYSVSVDLMEYDYKRIYRKFNISFFTKKNDLNQDFVEFEDLYDYENIEKLNSNSLIVLIKKFKLRFSFMKNFNFSREIIFSDDYDFNPELLKHDNHIIKIAIVKDNLDKWVYLSNYDYIFTLKDYRKELKQYGKVFSIKDQPIFNQIKFILNELYRKKENKFYYFIKNIKFNDIFPKWNNYFKVLNSNLFDDQWYHDTYELEDNTDSVVHFLLVGYQKKYNPGPNFNTELYYECNKDVLFKNLNPLVHYEQYGRKENRVFTLEEKNKRDYELILNSPYFDKEWYVDTYGVLGEDIDPVIHYLNEGYIKRYNPGPNFNTQEYFECNQDVKRILENPLIHYEMLGRKEKRKICFSDEQHQEDYNLILDSSFFDKEWYMSHYPDINEDPVYHYLNIGYTIGYNPGPQFNTDEYYECNLDVKKYGMNPLLHYERYGRTEGRKISP